MIKKDNIEDLYPLCALQEGMLYHALLDGEEATHFQQLRLDLSGNLDAERCRDTFTALVARHPVLRTAFVHKGAKRPMQVVLKHRSMDFKELDFTKLDPSVLPDEVAKVLAADRRRSFDLETDSLLRIKLIKRDVDSWILVMSFHHIVMDGWCTATIEREFHHIYESSQNGSSPRLAPAARFGDYIRYLKSLDSNSALEFWREVLDGYGTVSNLPFLLAGPKNKSYRHTSRYLSLNRTTTDKLRQISLDHRLTLSNLVMGLWGALLMRYHRHPDVVFGQTVSIRPPHLSGIEDAVGLYINTIPARIQGRWDQSLIDLATRFQETFVSSTPHRHLSLAEIQSLTDAGAGLIDHVVIFENLPASDGQRKNELAPGIAVVDASMFEQTSYPLELTVFPGDQLGIRFNFDANRFAPGAFDHLAEYFATLVQTFVHNPHQSMRQLLACSKKERAQIVDWSMATPAPSSRTRSIVEAWRYALHRNPHKTALKYHDRRLSFEQAHLSAERLASTLVAMGVEPGDRVGLMMERSQWPAVSILAILMSGASYVPIDPDSPVERARNMIEQAGCAIVLTHPNGILAAHEALPVRWVNPAQVSQADTDTPLPATDSTMEAYTIFTSGSTGQPKGVMVTHGNVVAFTQNLTERFGMTADDIIYASTTMTFDISVLELLCSLLCGLTVVIGKEVKQRHPEETIREIAENGCTVFQLTPSHLRALWDCDSFLKLNRLRVLLVGGEAFPSDLEGLSKRLNRTTIFNVYGPTETTIWSTSQKITDGLVTIGEPLIGESACIITEDDEIAPLGVWGEIRIGGTGVSAGYLNQPELTSQRFVKDVIHPAGRMYKTGDWGRRLPSGEIELKGRMDHQVKIRGFRIELDEVTLALRRVPHVQDGAVVASADEVAPQLVAYYTADQALSTSDLRDRLGQSLPHYMIPTRWVQLARLPTTPGGKLDLRAIVQQETEAVVPDNATRNEPRTPLESSVLAIFKEVLPPADFGVADNFFDLGGHSIRAMQIVSRIHKATSQEIPASISWKYSPLRSDRRYWINFSPIPPMRRSARHSYLFSNIKSSCRKTGPRLCSMDRR